MKKIVVFGTTSLSRMVAYEAMSHDVLEIAAFTADAEYLSQDHFMDWPLVDARSVEDLYPPAAFDMLLLFSGYQAMRQRQILFDRMKKKGYYLCNYVSPATDYAGPRIQGENNVILAGAHLGIHGVMGDNNLIRQQVYLGHDFKLGSHCVLAPRACVGGHVELGDNCYIGMNATIINNTVVAKESLVGAGAVVIHHTEAYSKNVGNPSRLIGYHLEKGIEMRVEHE